MAAASARRTSESWSASLSGRLGGGIFTSAVLQQLLREENLPDINPRDEEQVRTYQNVVAEIRSTLFNEVDVRFPTPPAFGAQDDRWEDEFCRRTGLELWGYWTRYNALRAIPAADLNPLGDRSRHRDDITPEETEAWEARHNLDANANCATRKLRGAFGAGARPSSGPLGSILHHMARKYMQTHPGPDTASCNVGAHRMIRQMLEGELPPEKQEELFDLLRYRLDALDLAESYAAALGVRFMAINEFDGRPWRQLHDSLEPAIESA
ncbi:MAG: hypothetical protein M1826_004942 [Phylliscum demangeonii]|nr:MAG: hypothetical protein M1826_004942 [Phylliscum demangeonii]